MRAVKRAAITVGEFMERLDHRISRADAVASLGHTVADSEGGEP